MLDIFFFSINIYILVISFAYYNFCNHYLIQNFNQFIVLPDNVNINTTQRFGQIPFLLIPQTEQPEPPLTRQQGKIRVNPLTQRPSTSNALQQIQHDNITEKTLRSSLANSAATGNNNKVATSLTNSLVSNFLANQISGQQQQLQQQQQPPQPPQQSQQLQTNVQNANDSSANTKRPKTESTTATPTTPATSRQPQRRRVRRKANSPADPSDQAEHLTEMSVRGLDLFRYAKIFDGIYQCTECAKENVQKTFKNKYSFQRHAFLYHEGTQRKVFPCPVCSKEFSRPDKMKNHMKTTHDCYMPKDTVYPLNFLAGSGGDMPGAVPSPDINAKSSAKVKESKAKDKKTANDNNATNTCEASAPKVDELLNRLQQSSSHLRIENVMSNYNAQLQSTAQHIKVENSSD